MPTTTAIDPKASLRGQQITPGQVNTTITPGQSNFTPVSGIDNVTAQTIRGGPGVDPTANAAVGQSATAGNRLGHNINTTSVMRNAMDAFNSQLAGMNIDFADQSDQLAKRTAAMGRTGSGLFNRDTGYISDRSRAAREGMLGNLSFTAAQSDAANRLQAQIEQGRLREAQEGRFANTSVENMRSLNQLAGLNSTNALKASMGNQDIASRMAMANAANTLSADQGNQRIGAETGMFNARSGMMNDQFNVGNDLMAQIQSAGNAMRGREFDAGFMQDERSYQDQLARQAQQDLYNQMQLFSQGFQGDPTGTMMGAGGNIANLAQMYGQNAGQTNQGIGQGVQGLLQMLLMGQGGPQTRTLLPQLPPPPPSGVQVSPQAADRWTGGA